MIDRMEFNRDITRLRNEDQYLLTKGNIQRLLLQITFANTKIKSETFFIALKTRYAEQATIIQHIW